jgi:hypothetical protein
MQPSPPTTVCMSLVDNARGASVTSVALLVFLRSGLFMAASFLGKWITDSDLPSMERGASRAELLHERAIASANRAAGRSADWSSQATQPLGRMEGELSGGPEGADDAVAAETFDAAPRAIFGVFGDLPEPNRNEGVVHRG